MSNTRTVISPGIFADDAATTIPPAPVQGTAYRNTALSTNDTEQGWPYAIPVASDIFNEIMFRCTSLIDIMDSQGMLGWTNLKNYAIGAWVLGSDRLMYRAAVANGPSTSVVDPVGNPATWVPQFALASNAETIAGTLTTKAVTPNGLWNLLNGVGQQSRAASGFQRIGGLIVQWVPVTVPGAGSGSAPWPIPFPTACLVSIPGSQAAAASPAYIPTPGTTTTAFADFANSADGGTVVVIGIGH